MPIKNLLFALLCSPLVVLAATAPLGSDPGADPPPEIVDIDRPWVEQAVTWPELPRDGDLVEVAALRGLPGVRLYLDRRALRRDPDRVVRYTVVIEAAAGARNLYYEGLRCEEQVFRRYAVATGSGAFEAYLNPDWEGLVEGRGQAYRRFLARDLLCDSVRRPLAPHEVIERAQRTLLKGIDAVD